jgi:hypothetical protein
MSQAFPSLGDPSPTRSGPPPRYRNYPPDQLVDLVARLLALVPPWTRVYRIQRDIPMPLVTSGVEKGNLRELALARMADLGTRCRDVRTREAGIQVGAATRAEAAAEELPWIGPVFLMPASCSIMFSACCDGRVLRRGAEVNLQRGYKELPKSTSPRKLAAASVVPSVVSHCLESVPR